jgi:hypothetical protein
MKNLRLRERSKDLSHWFKRLPQAWGGELAVAHSALSAKLIRADGSTVDYGVVCKKKVTNVFVADIVGALANGAAYSSFNLFKCHRAGIGTGAEANTDTVSTFNFTGCPTEVNTGTQVAGGSGGARTYTSVATISFTSTLAITEHGISNNATFASGTLLDRSVFTAINVVNGDSIQFTYVLTVNSEA